MSPFESNSPCPKLGRKRFASCLGFSLVVQLEKNPPAIQETWVQSLGWEDPLEKGKLTHSSILAWRIAQTVQSMGVASRQARLSDFHFHWA